jgi:hypothetical protein
LNAVAVRWMTFLRRGGAAGRRVVSWPRGAAAARRPGERHVRAWPDGPARVLDLGVGPDGAEHRVEGEAHEERHHHGERHRDAELVEDLPDLPAHERHGDEHRDHGERGGEDGEADLVGAVLGRLLVVLPISRWRTMFSRTTIASSTRRPMASESASSVIVLSVKLNAHMMKNAEMIEIGSASPVMIVERQELRKK